MALGLRHFYFVGFACLLSGCMGEPESTIKIVSKPLGSRPSLAPNSVTQREPARSPQSPPKAKSDLLAMQPSAAPPATGNTKPDNKPIDSKREARRESQPKSHLAPEAAIATVAATAPVPTVTASDKPMELAERGAPATFSSFGPPRNESRIEMKFGKPSLPSDIPSWFSENDKDNDGMVGMHEWPKDRRTEFAKYDRNNDGLVTIDEAMRTIARPKATVASTTIVASATSPTATTPTASSSDPDAANKSWAEGTLKRYGNKKQEGRIFADEMPFFLKKERFSEFDANKDGSLDVTELTAFLKATKDTGGGTTVASTDGNRGDNGGGFNRGGEGRRDGGNGGERRESRMGGGFGGDNRGGPGGPGGGDGGRRGFGMGGGGNGDPDAWMKTMFGRLDKKGTGKLSKEDFPDYMRERHAEYDSNKDGSVDFEEYKAGMAKRFQRR